MAKFILWTLSPVMSHQSLSLLLMLKPHVFVFTSFIIGCVHYALKG